MLSLNKYMKEKYPDIFKEYEKYRKVEEKKKKKAEEEKAKKDREKARKNRGPLEDYGFYYEFETSYKGWTEGPHDGDCSLDDAFSDVEDEFELDPTGLHGMSFKEFLEYQCYDNEKEFFDKWFAIFDGKDDTLREKMDNRMWDARMVSNPEWEGTYYYNKNEIKNFFRKATYIKTAKKK